MTEDAPERAAGRVRDMVEVPEDLVGLLHDLIDRIFTFAFDVLDLQTIDLGIRPMLLAGHPD